MANYVFVQKEGADWTGIKLTDEKYKNIVFKYGKVAFAKDENPDGTLPMKFDYIILQNPNLIDIDKNEFIDYIGDILLEILEKQIKEGTAIID
jgi:hypothetical protein